MHLLFLPVVLCAVDVEEEILRFFSYEHLLAEGLTLYLYAEIELFVESVL